MRIIWFPCSFRPRDMGQQALSHLFDISYVWERKREVITYKADCVHFVVKRAI